MFLSSASRALFFSFGPQGDAGPTIFAVCVYGAGRVSSVLRSKRAVQVNVEIMRAFVRLRRILASNEDLARKLAALEKKYDSQFRVVFEAIRELVAPSRPQQTQDRISDEGTSSAVRKRVERLFPRFRNSENVEVSCWKEWYTLQQNSSNSHFDVSRILGT